MRTRYARRNIAAPLFWSHPTLSISVADLELRIYDESYTLLTTLPAPPVPIPAGLYSTADWTPTSSGIYRLQWYSLLSGISDPETLFVSDHPEGDIEVGAAQHLPHKFAGTGYAACSLTIYDADLVAWGSSPYDVSETSYLTVYATDDEITIPSEGTYILYWQTSGANAIDIVYVGDERGLRDVRIYTIDMTTEVPDRLPFCTVLASLEDGTPIAQVTTDADGRGVFSLVEGTTYVFSLKKTGLVFTSNNFSFEIVNPAEASVPAQANHFQLRTAVFAPTFDPIEALNTSQLSLMKVRVVDILGRPLRDAGILIDHQFVPDKVTVSGNAYMVLGDNVLLRTDANGYAECYLIRGQHVVVTIEGTPFRRYITVPAAAEFGLADQITADNDPFTIVAPNIPTAPRRSP